MSDERSENRFLILIVQKSLQIALKFFRYATTWPSEKITCCLYTLIRVIENIILTICSNHHLWCLSFFWSYLSNFFVASFFLAYISVIYVWSPNLLCYKKFFNHDWSHSKSARQRNQTFYLSKGKIGTQKFSFPISLAFTMRCFKSSKICWIEIDIAKLIKYW